MKAKRISKLKVAALMLAVLLGAAVWYVQANPRIFNESFLEHAHCIVMAGQDLSSYASEHGGQFPVHTNGYGDALLLLAPDHNSWFGPLTGPGFSADVLKNAKATGTDVNEAECGRVYIQGLKIDSDREIALLFDKLPTPGDHCHVFGRFTRPFGREVWFIGGGHEFIPNKDWPSFASNQINHLVWAGIPKPVAKSYYENLPD